MAISCCFKGGIFSFYILMSLCLGCCHAAVFSPFLGYCVGDACCCGKSLTDPIYKIGVFLRDDLCAIGCGRKD